MAKNVVSQAWRFSAHGGQFQSLLKVEQISLQKAAGQALLRMQAAPITIADVDQIRGLQGKVAVPATAGLFGVGVVTEAAGNLKEGDWAVLAAGSGSGSWSQYAAVNPANLIKVPSTLPVEYASLLAVGPMVAYQILKASGLKAGDALVLNGANSPIGLAVLQLAKQWGIDAVGIATGAAPLQIEKLRQMGLTVLSGYAFDAAKVFGAVRPKFALGLVGGTDSALLAHLLGPNGKLVIVPTASAAAHVIPSADLAAKQLELQAVSGLKILEAASGAQSEAMVAELTDLILSHNLKAAPIVRHEFRNLLSAVAEAERGLYNAVVMHEGTEKTWSNKTRDTYMAIDEQLQGSWDAAAAAQDPYLKLGRDQPWELLAQPDGELDLPPQLRAKFANVTNETELLAVLDTLSFKEKHLLGLPTPEALTVTAEELKKLVKDFSA